MQFLGYTRIPFIYINLVWLFCCKWLQGWRDEKVRPRARMENLLSLYSRAHVGFCKRCCPIAEKEVSALRLLIGSQERANVLRS